MQVTAAELDELLGDLAWIRRQVADLATLQAADVVTLRVLRAVASQLEDRWRQKWLDAVREEAK